MIFSNYNMKIALPFMNGSICLPTNYKGLSKSMIRVTYIYCIHISMKSRIDKYAEKNNTLLPH